LNAFYFHGDAPINDIICHFQIVVNLLVVT
jgi:hypothetical protein